MTKCTVFEKKYAKNTRMTSYFCWKCTFDEHFFYPMRPQESSHDWQVSDTTEAARQHQKGNMEDVVCILHTYYIRQLQLNLKCITYSDSI